MVLPITTTYQPATDIGSLRHKHPAHLHTVSLSFGKAHVFYPEATAERCTVALLLDVDPVALVRKHTPAGERFALEQYAMTALRGVLLYERRPGAGVWHVIVRQKARPQALVEQPMPLEVQLPVLPCRGGEALRRRLFEPLGYEVAAQRYLLDEHFSD